MTQLVKAVRCKPEGRGVRFPMGSVVTGIFNRFNPSGPNMALWSTQPLTEMSSTNIPWGVKATGAQG